MPQLLLLAGPFMCEIGAYNMCPGASITVVRWHYYGRGRGPYHISRTVIAVFGWHGYVRGRVP